MESPAFFLILTVITFAGHIHGQTLHASQNPTAVGSNVTIFSDSTSHVGGWLFNTNIAVSIYPGGMVVDKFWNGRLIYNVTTSSLTIISTRLEDSGIYTLQEMNNWTIHLDLSVQVPVSNVTLSATKTNLVEFKDSVVFTCSVSTGTSLTFTWFEGNATVSGGGGLQLSNGNTTLTIMNVTRYNQGPFKCVVSNGLGNETSPSVLLNISYGPDNAKIAAMPMRSMYRSGSNITLWCTADSKPPAIIQWMVNGVGLNLYGPQLNLQNNTENNSGRNYTCVLSNTVTQKWSSASTVIQVMNPITAVDVIQTGVPAILDGSFTLSCKVTGPVATILWWKDGLLISANNTVFGAGNVTLTLNPVQYSDGGNYQCQAFNLVSDKTSSPYAVLVNYGPEVPVITGPVVVKAGDNVTLSCWADSVPQSIYEWYFNGSLVSSMSEYVTPPFTSEMSGMFICMAFNNVTGQNSTASFMPTVVDPIKSVQISKPMLPAVEGSSYELTCVVIGTVDSIYWMKNGEPLNADNITAFIMDNNTLMFMPVERSDSGNYQCTAVDAVGNLTSDPFMLWVNYGPEMPIIMGSSLAMMGDNVTLTCYAASIPPSFYRWYFNDSLVSNMSEYITPSLTDNMSGTYTCMAFNNITNLNSTASMMLTVIDPIQSVLIIGPSFPAIQGDQYELTCNTIGTVDNIYWMKNGKPLHADNRTVFNMYNNTVTFMPVEHSDTGDYKCVASNALENMTSLSYKLLVNFGPTTPSIYGPAFVETGSQAVFNCFAMSVPPSSFSWWFNGSMMSNTSQFNTGPLTLNMSGEYTCMAYNNVTGKNSTNSRMLTVIEAIKSVMILNNTYPINQQNFTLMCLVVGPYDTIYWLKNGTPLSMNATNSNSSMYHFENNMLYFTPLSMQSQGTYQCVATNKAARHTSRWYMLLVYYGPQNLYITGPDSAKQGVSVSLTCSADSQPACDFYWFLNNQSMLLRKGSVITFTAAKSNTGNYICEAKNPMTNVTMTQSKAFAISSHASATHFITKGGLMFMGLCALTVHLLNL